MTSWLNSVTSYFYAPSDQADADQRDNLQELRNNYNENDAKHESPLQGSPQKSSIQTGTSIMSSLMNITAGYPKCYITLENEKGYYSNDDDVKGSIEIKTPTEGQIINHDGIKISLIGLIENVTQSSGFLMGGGSQSAIRNYNFLQLSRDLECAGSFQDSLQRNFSFNKLEFQHDTYTGIGINLRYVLKVEMSYQGSIMKSQLVEEGNLLVKNFAQIEKDEENLNLIPKLKLELLPFHHPEPPLVIEVHLEKSKYNIEQEFVEGYLRFKQVNLKTMEKVKDVTIELIQQEIQGNAQNSTQLAQTSTIQAPYQLRVIKSYQIIDGCPQSDDNISFRLPLRGVRFITPTLKNVMNKFSVRYYLKCIVTEFKAPTVEGNQNNIDEIEEQEVKSNLHGDLSSAEITEIFNLFDKNSDGKVNTSELGTIVRALNLNPTETEIQEMNIKVDPQRKGEFTLQALETLIRERGKDVDSLDDLKEALKVFDTDHDGKITVEEFKYAMMTMGEKMQEHEIEEIISDTSLVQNNLILIDDFAKLIMNRI